MARTTTEDPALAGARWAPAMRALGDERLARMVESGSESAFAAIYGRYAPLLHGYCRSLLRDDEEAGDALQNAMLKALQAMRRAGRTGPLRPWLFRIAHNESVTIIRQRTRRPGPLEDSMIDSTRPDDAFRRAAAREQLAALLDDMQNLTEYQRGAIVMRELGGLTYDEIGSALDTTPLAARQAVFVARRRLSEGPAGQRALRPALLGLVAPAPVGLALAGALGGASAGVGAAKVLVATAAVVSIGVGSVELVQHPEPAPPKRQAAAAESSADRDRDRRRAVAAAATAVPSATPVAARRSSSSTAVDEASANPRPASTATVRFVAATQHQTPEREQPQRHEPAQEQPPAERPAPVETVQPDPTRPPPRHRERPPAPTPAPVASEPTPAPRAPVEGESRHRPEYDSGHVSSTSTYTSRDSGGRDCPPRGQETTEAAPEPTVMPVQ